MKGLLALAALAVASAPPELPRAVPFGGWDFHSDEDSCRGSHNYVVRGRTLTLSIEPRVIGSGAQVFLRLPSEGAVLKYEPAQILVGTERIKDLQLLRDPLERADTAKFRFALTADEYSALLQRRELSISSKSVKTTFGMHDLSEIDSKLVECTNRLLDQWGIAKEKAASIAEGPKSAAGDLAFYFTPYDYPVDALRRGAQGTVRVILDVDDAGKVSGCRIVRSSGDEALDNRTCEVLSKRARLQPALNSSGKAIPGLMYARVTWRLG